MIDSRFDRGRLLFGHQMLNPHETIGSTQRKGRFLSYVSFLHIIFNISGLGRHQKDWGGTKMESKLVSLILRFDSTQMDFVVEFCLQ